MFMGWKSKAKFDRRMKKWAMLRYELAQTKMRGKERTHNFKWTTKTRRPISFTPKGADHVFQSATWSNL